MKKIQIILTIVLALTLSVVAFSQTKKVEKAVQTQQKEVYACPMHPDIVSANADKCSKCGMNLVKMASDKKAVKQVKPKDAKEMFTYTCPMHPEVVSDKAGKCSKCGMNLDKVAVNQEQVKKMKPENMKLEVGKKKK